MPLGHVRDRFLNLLMKSFADSPFFYFCSMRVGVDTLVSSMRDGPLPELSWSPYGGILLSSCDCAKITSIITFCCSIITCFWTRSSWCLSLWSKLPTLSPVVLAKRPWDWKELVISEEAMLSAPHICFPLLASCCKKENLIDLLLLIWF